MRNWICLIGLGSALVFAGCETNHRIEADTVHRVEVAPVHVTVDVNIKVQNELNELFAFEEEYR